MKPQMNTDEHRWTPIRSVFVGVHRRLHFVAVFADENPWQLAKDFWRNTTKQGQLRETSSFFKTVTPRESMRGTVVSSGFYGQARRVPGRDRNRRKGAGASLCSGGCACRHWIALGGASTIGGTG